MTNASTAETDLATAQDNVTIKTNEVASARDALVGANEAYSDKELKSSNLGKLRR